jgi:hypothetical protein
MHALSLIYTRSGQIKNAEITEETEHVLSRSKPLFDESPSASTTLLEEYQQISQPIFPPWPSHLPDFIVPPNNEHSSPPSANIAEVDSSSLLKSPFNTSQVTDVPVISLASLDDMLNKYKRRYGCCLFRSACG